MFRASLLIYIKLSNSPSILGSTKVLFVVHCMPPWCPFFKREESVPPLKLFHAILSFISVYSIPTLIRTQCL